MLTTQQKTGFSILQVSTFFRPPCHILSDQPGASGQALWELLWRTEAVTFQRGPAPPRLPPLPPLPKETAHRARPSLYWQLCETLGFACPTLSPTITFSPSTAAQSRGPSGLLGGLRCSLGPERWLLEVRELRESSEALTECPRGRLASRALSCVSGALRF